MSAISRLILIQPDRPLSESLRFGFEREGVAVAQLDRADLDPVRLRDPADLVIAGGRDAAEGAAILGHVRRALRDSGMAVPVLYVGNGISREKALEEGASEFLGRPAFVRDAVTIGRLLASPRQDKPGVLGGELIDHFGVYYLVRALAAVKRTGVLTLVRGLRRGELRFYRGEVTAAQAGMRHGLGAFHQLLLWTAGRFELCPEEVVRRRQIPLAPHELLADAERFLDEVSSVAGALSASAVYEINQSQLARVAGQIPEPIEAVMRLFDGTRTVADVVEDSAFRMFETFRMGDRLCELGLIQLSRAPRSHHKTHAALAIEEWLRGSEQKDGTGAGHVTVRKSEQPEAAAAPGRGRRRRKRRRGRSEGAAARARAAAPVTAVAPPSGDPLVIDWEQLLPQPSGAADAGMSPVVPSTAAAGEIAVSSAPPVPPPTRERIEEMVSANKLVQLFSGQPDAGAESDAASTESQMRVDPDDISTEPQPKLEGAVVADSDLAAETAGETAGEIEMPGWSSMAPAPALPEPSILVDKPAAAPAPPIAPAAAATPAPLPTRRTKPSTAPPLASGGSQFSADEEAFFAQGAELASQDAPDESFDDLDEGQPPPQNFWRRLFGGGRKPARPPSGGKTRH
jgi:hypothetical protein